MSDERVSSLRTFRLPYDGIAPPGAFRLLLAFAVVVSHISAIDIGRLGVLLFFYLSGYWTAVIWRQKFGGRAVGRFYLSRYWRVAPLFLLIGITAALVRGFPIRLENFTLLGIGSSNNDPTGVSWSLDVELQFYLLLPLVIAALTAAPWRTLAASLVIAVVGVWLDLRYEVTTVLKYLPAFLLGAMTFTAAWKPSLRTAHLSLAGFILFTVGTMATPFFLKTTPDPFDQDIWGFFWMLPLLPYVAHSLTVRSTPLDRDLGNLSYPLYLIHYAVIALATQNFGYGMPVKLGAVALSCALALAVYYFVDRPIDRVRVAVTEGKR